MGHIYISAAHKSSGKTTLSIGLCAAMHADGKIVQPFKKGPDYIDPLWLAQAAQRTCYNLDFYTMQREEIADLFASKMVNADIGLIEGNKGLFDGLDLDGSNSNAALSVQLSSPVVLVLDTQGMTRGVAPLILGYQAFDPDIHIGGVILNKVGGSRHEAKLQQVIEHYTDVPVIGSVHRSAEMEIAERHLGLVPSNEADKSREQIERMGQRVAAQVDLTALYGIAAQAGAVPQVPSIDRPSHEGAAIIAYAQDSAFGFYYSSDLEAMHEAGAVLVPFSPLTDAELPPCDGVFLGGGFPETHVEALAGNRSMLDSVRGFIESDGPVYAECGGLMYLSRELTWGEKHGKMAGIIPGSISLHAKPQGRGYVRLRETSEHPWPSGSDGAVVSAHEFHYSSLDDLAPDMRFAYEVERGFGIDGQHDGLRYRNLLANYAHLRDTRNNHWASRFVGFVRECRQRPGA